MATGRFDLLRVPDRRPAPRAVSRRRLPAAPAARRGGPRGRRDRRVPVRGRLDDPRVLRLGAGRSPAIEARSARRPPTPTCPAGSRSSRRGTRAPGWSRGLSAASRGRPRAGAARRDLVTGRRGPAPVRRRPRSVAVALLAPHQVGRPRLLEAGELAARAALLRGQRCSSAAGRRAAPCVVGVPCARRPRSRRRHLSCGVEPPAGALRGRAMNASVSSHAARAGVGELGGLAVEEAVRRARVGRRGGARRRPPSSAASNAAIGLRR